MNRLFSTSLAAVVAALFAPVVTFLRPVDGLGGGSDTVRTASGQVLDPDSISDGEGALGVLGGEKVVVIRRGAAYTALSATCTHLGCLVRLAPAGLRVVVDDSRT